jgi:magnesium-transporting ATPase (P-type)
MKFDCQASEEEYINAKLPKFATGNKLVQSMEIEENPDQSGSADVTKFKVIRRMVFNSDRKRMSVLLIDPTDGKTKLYVKGADSIIMDRIDKKTLSDSQA